MSVAMGMASPVAPGVWRVSSAKSVTGTIIPPTAAMIGKRACRKLDNSPTSISRLISSPTLKKKIAISASLMKPVRVSGCPP